MLHSSSHILGTSYGTLGQENDIQDIPFSTRQGTFSNIEFTMRLDTADTDRDRRFVLEYAERKL